MKRFLFGIFDVLLIIFLGRLFMLYMAMVVFLLAADQPGSVKIGLAIIGFVVINLVGFTQLRKLYRGKSKPDTAIGPPITYWQAGSGTPSKPL